MNLSRCLVLLTVPLLAAADLTAQSRYPWSLQGSGAIVKPFSDKNLNGSTGGSYPFSVGIEGQVRYSSKGPLSVGFGFQISDLGDADGSQLAVIFVEPRLRINVPAGRIGPYLTVRAGYGLVRYFDPADNTPPYDNINESGASIGGGAGFLYRFSRRVGIDLGFLVNSAPEPVGPYALLRAGLSIGLGQPHRL